jgi:hypothetical protein
MRQDHWDVLGHVDAVGRERDPPRLPVDADDPRHPIGDDQAADDAAGREFRIFADLGLGSIQLDLDRLGR